MVNKSIVIGILARDCESALKKNIGKVESLGRHFLSYKVVIFENDSKDGTKKILQKWAGDNENIVLISENNGTVTIPPQTDEVPFPGWSKGRIEKMSGYRNRLLDEIGKRFRPDYLCFIDIDLYDFSVEGIVSAIKNAPDGWGGLFANGRNQCTVNGELRLFPCQYDPYAFLPLGVDYTLASSYKFTHDDDIYKGYAMHGFVSENGNDYVPCQSAFGGIGVYRYSCIDGLRYSACVLPEYEKDSIALCEHVPFNCKLAERGYKLYIAKDMLTIRESWDKDTTKGVQHLFKQCIKDRFKEPFIGQSSSKRYSVLSYIFNGYEKVHEVGEKDPDAEYLLITDDIFLESDTWNVIYDPFLDGMSPFDKTFYVRYNCFRYCHTDICLRIDGSIRVRHSLKPLIDIFVDGGYDACLMPHPTRCNFREEYDVWIKVRNYPEKQAEKCMEDFKLKGYDFSYKGMFQACFSIQRRGRTTDDIDRMTYTYLKELGEKGNMERLDQIPFSYIMNTHFSHLNILPVSEQILRSYYMQWYEHGGFKPNLNIFYNRKETDIKYMFNKPVTCMYLDTPANKIIEREEDLFEDLISMVRQFEIERSKQNHGLWKKFI